MSPSTPLVRILLCCLLMAAAACTGRNEVDPEALLEQQPSGAGPVNEELETRPSYFRSWR